METASNPIIANVRVSVGVIDKSYKVIKAQSSEVDKEAIRSILEIEAHGVHTWSNGPGYFYAPHSHSYKKILYCLSGSITFHLIDQNVDVVLMPGDRMELEPYTLHSAKVGSEGVVCIEGQAKH